MCCCASRNKFDQALDLHPTSACAQSPQIAVRTAYQYLATLMNQPTGELLLPGGNSSSPVGRAYEIGLARGRLLHRRSQHARRRSTCDLWERYHSPHHSIATSGPHLLPAQQLWVPACGRTFPAPWGSIPRGPDSG